jgi:ubiquinone/menaquinone biosynthesis C-methylase UbiE
MSQAIDPRKIIQERTIEELNLTAEQYFQSIVDPTPHLAKPFHSILEAPITFAQLGALFAGLRLGRTMRVLDFGAGSCWLSRFLNQMQCITISVDVSSSALEMGKKLLADYPIIGPCLEPPSFVLFDGHRLDVADESVDRIVCFAAFHHVPNQRQVLREFHRVLKPGGIVGFSEPGIGHSQTAQSQFEMKHHAVLENDINLTEIKRLAEEEGFTDLYVKPFVEPTLDMTYDDYLKIVKRRKIPAALASWIVSSTQNTTVFFLSKGKFLPDSRNYIGLQHQIRAERQQYRVKAGEPLNLPLRLRNRGYANWLHTNRFNIGIVKVGAHLYDSQQQMLELDFYRSNLPAAVAPGTEITHTITPVFTQKGSYILGLDLVAEGVCWFENVGSQPVYVKVVVE